MASIISAGTTSGTALNMSGDTSGALQLATNGTTTAMTIDTSQNVGIGTTSPATKLEVASPAATPVVLRLASNKTGTGSGDKGRLDFYSADNSGTAYQLGYMDCDRSDGTGTASYIAWANRVSGTVAERMRISDGGGLSVGTTNSPAKFTVSGQGGSNVWVQNNINTGTGAIVSLGFSNDNGLVGYVQTSGSSTTYVTSSDYRLKDNIVPMTGALAKVAQLKPVTYKWKVDNTQSQGFIAHELQEVVPECVTGTKDATREEEYEVTPAVKDEQGNITTPAVMSTRTVPAYQGIDTSFLVATLTAAIQELKAINDTQAETINALTARIVALEK
jgi:hypothetical protein